MPLQEVQRFRCKDCQDTGMLSVRALSSQNPMNTREQMSDEDPRTGFDARLALRSPARATMVDVRCTFCPPAPRPVYRRDWERP